MRLKRIEILGFKSFADRTVLNFHEGITGIVGPNGCGKSNISDAFRWVLGEQSAKSMRGSKMMDVIFAGAFKRKPLNIAEVTLSFTDIEGMPVTELSITRRLQRSGESDYLVNKKSARLRDVQDLFLDSGVGKDAFSIFEQGKIDQVIHHSPLERRAIFEEASGILRFLIRKKEALQKLEQVEINLSRVLDIHAEVQSQIVVLEGQAIKALAYKAMKKEFEELEREVLFKKWEKKRGQRTVAQESFEKTQCICGLLRSEIESLSQELKDTRCAQEFARGDFKEKNQFVNELKKEIAVTKRQVESEKERLLEIEINEKKWRKNLEEHQKMRFSWIENRAQLEKNLEKIPLEFFEKDLEEKRKGVGSLEVEVNLLRQQLEQLEKKKYTLLQREKQLETEYRSALIKEEHAIETKRSLEKKIRECSIALSKSDEKIIQDLSFVEIIEKSLMEKKEHFQKKENSIQEQLEAIQRDQLEYHASEKRVAEYLARRQVLAKLQEEKSGFSQASKRILKEAGLKNSSLNIVGLYEWMAPSDVNNKMIATVMRPYMQTLVVKTKSDLKAVLSFAKDKKLKDFSILCLEHLEDLDDRNSLEHHFCKGIVFVDNEEAVLAFLDKEKSSLIFSEDGFYADYNRVLFYQTQGENHVFLREAEIKGLEKEIEINQREFDDAKEKLKKKKESYQKEVLVIKELDLEIRALEKRSIEAEVMLKRLKAESYHKMKQIEQDESELLNLDLMIADFKKKSQDLENVLKVLQNDAEIFRVDDTSLKLVLEEKSSLLLKLQKELQKMDRDFNVALEEKRKIGHALQVIEIKEQDSWRQQKLLEGEICSVDSLRNAVMLKEEVLLKELEKLNRSITASEEDLLSCETKVADYQKRIQNREDKLDQLRTKLKHHDGEGYQFGLSIAKLDSSLSTLENELLERYKLSPVANQKDCGLLKISVEVAEKRLKELRDTIENTDEINLTSIEECEKCKERLAFISEQLEDLNHAKGQLLAIITDLDKKSRRIFKETFAAIRESFQKNFTLLFSGGEADLIFTETLDVLEAGVDIVARPAGKKMQSIQLMSGGEKCLTAMALLFAIFEVKPSPFCILDEIDAPLDDANVERFMRIVTKYADRCQFIIVTHNKETMGKCDQLFGVSMEERGVSKILGIEFAKNLFKISDSKESVVFEPSHG